MKNTYILMRHGQTKYQANGWDILYPQEEQATLSITKQGQEKIKHQAKKLKSKNIDLIYSSDYYRTKQTSGIVLKEVFAPIKFDKRLRDTNFGEFSGKDVKEYKKIFSSKIQRFSKRPEKGESWRDVKKRLKSFLAEIEKKHKNKKILIISHADPLWLLAGAIKGLTEKELLKRRTRGGLLPDVGDYMEM